MFDRVVRLASNGDAPGRSLWMWCPGCDDAHRITVGDECGWAWDGNETAPTISPSIKVTGVQWDESYSFHKPNHLAAPGQPIVCHSFVRAGRWEFLSDCTHTLAGQTVPMVPLPKWLSGARSEADEG